MTDTLKPCPFCGEAVTQIDGYGLDEMGYVFCKPCGAIGPDLRNITWNHRFPDSWQPIETAPKDGTEILGFWSYLYEGDSELTTGIQLIEYVPSKTGYNWQSVCESNKEDIFTHWMPLPPPPKQ